MFSDKEGIINSRDAVALKVDSDDCVLCGSPSTNDIDSSCLCVGSFGARKVLDIERWIILRIGGSGGHDDDGRVGRKHSNGGVLSLDKHVVTRAGGQSLDKERV